MSPEQSDYVDRHAGEQVIIIGNGPSLKNIPIGFIESRTNIGINYLRQKIPWIRLDYWMATDKEVVLDLVSDINGIPKFIPTRYMNIVKVDLDPDNFDEIVPMALMEDIPGTRYSPVYGASYTTTLAAAAHMAFLMGAIEILAVGFDCSFYKGNREYIGDGKSKLPHFYDDKPAMLYKREWDNDVFYVDRYIRGHGSGVVNLSQPTLSKRLEKSIYSEYWSPPDQIIVEKGY